MGGAQRIAKSGLREGLINAVGIGSGSEETVQMAAMIGQMINMKYGRDDEVQSDELGVRFMCQAGYDPHRRVRIFRE